MSDMERFQTLSRQLRGVAINHASEQLGFGKIRVADMAADCANAIDELVELYNAATATPQNLPLTREQVEALPKNTPVWIYTHGGYPYALRTAERCQHLADAYFIFECAKPTPADISAALAGKGEENE